MIEIIIVPWWLWQTNLISSKVFFFKEHTFVKENEKSFGLYIYIYIWNGIFKINYLAACAQATPILWYKRFYFFNDYVQFECKNEGKLDVFP